MGTRPPHTTLTGKARHSNKNQSPPHKGRSLPCAASTTTTPTRRHLDAAQPTHHKLELELDRSQRGLRPISRRRCTDLAAELDRSRRGTGPISARVTTDLDAARNRPQGGERGIRTPGAPGAQRFSRPPHSAALSSLHARTTTRTTRCSCGRPDTTTTAPKRNAVVHVDKPRARCVLVTLVWQRHCPCPRGQTASAESTSIGCADRRQPREKNPRLRVGLADAGTGEAGLSRRPSAKACAIAGHTGRRGMSVACRAW